MKAAILSALVAVNLVLAGFDTWSPPGPYDVRAPCPMLNTLANHGFLPHDGKDISREATENALFDALNINKTLGGFLFDFAITTNPKPNATAFSLNDLGNHNVLEHDASLSRSDAFFGNVLTFNQSIFDETRTFWTDETLDIQMAANARVGRIKTSRATNPTYELSELGTAFTFGESVAYIILIGDKHSGTANRSWVEYFFEHEQLPLHLGWHRAAELFQEIDLDRYMDEIQNLTEATAEVAPAARQRRSGHFGW
ncbi:Chloroperoxidase [Lasiosphaeria hispida]|uniref:Chloroperoxidase n=1 Tax=Lasiosphaeria hispida TaxID=260671 RepID=A0AAJ0MC25_9PEZI|nr:Chloroperoxidase [Lasiosphaeria hispida]